MDLTQNRELQASLPETEETFVRQMIAEVLPISKPRGQAASDPGFPGVVLGFKAGR